MEEVRYDTAEYAGNRLNDSIIRFNGKPIRVSACGGNGSDIVVSGEYLQTGKAIRASLKDVDLEPVKLGFVNTDRGIGYLVRIPLRRDWKQGLRSNNMRSVYGVDCRNLTDRDLYRVIMGIYPSFTDALENTVCDGVARAFSRNFAILVVDGKPKLVYKNIGIVGFVENDRPVLRDNCGHLTKELESVLE